MGSGSSKKSQQPAKKTAPPKPVANVNKQDNNNFLDQNYNNDDTKVNHTVPNDKNSKKRDENEYNKKQDKSKDKENKKMKMDQKPRENMLTFEEDSDIDNDIDEVLKMPMAIEYPKPKKKDKKEKKNKEEISNNYDRNLDRDLFNSNPNEPVRTEDLPESYAQRLQRQQYKMQQDFLIRQKTMHRNSKEWDDFDDGDENENYMNKGFDASKFRAVNKGQDVKKDLFKTTAPEEADLETPRYLQADQGMDDFQVSRRPPSPKRDLPSYNQSEIDLMNELEKDLL